MNFDEAIKAHSDWKFKLQRYLRSPDGSINADELAKDNICSLGGWLYSEGKKYSHLPEFKQLLEEHKGFHKEAADIVRKKDKGESITEAFALSSHSPFMTHSTNVVSILMKFRRMIP